MVPSPKSIRRQAVEEDKLGPVESKPRLRTAKPATSVAKGPSKAGRSELLDKRPCRSRFRLPSQSRLVCLTDRESPTAEAIRLLGVRLRDLRQIRPLKTVLITSTIPQEGKSTISANLACVLSQTSGERTLLLEGDLRRPSLLQIFGTEATSGISECLKDEGRQLAGIYRLEDAGCWILPAGRSPSNPLELLQSHELKVVMERLTAMLRLDYYRFASRAAFGRYKHLDAHGRRSSSGYAPGDNRETPVAKGT